MQSSSRKLPKDGHITPRPKFHASPTTPFTESRLNRPTNPPNKPTNPAEKNFATIEFEKVQRGKTRCQLSVNQVSGREGNINVLDREVGSMKALIQTQSDELALLKMHQTSRLQSQQYLEKELKKERLRNAELESQIKLNSVQPNGSRLCQNARGEEERMLSPRDASSRHLSSERQNGEHERSVIVERFSRTDNMNESDISRLQRINRQMAEKVGELQEKINILRTQQEHSRDEILKMEVEAKERDSEMESLKGELDKNQSHNREIEELLRELLAEKESTQMRQQQLEAEINARYTEKLNSMRDQLLNRISEIEQRYKELDEAYQAEKQEKELFKSMVDGSNSNSNMEASRRNEQSQVQIFEQAEYAAARRGQSERERSEMKAKDETELRILEERVIELNERLTSMDTHIIMLEEEKKALLQKDCTGCAELERLNKANTERLHKLKEQINDVRSKWGFEREKMKLTESASDQKIRRLSAENRVLTSKYEEAEAARKELHRKLDVLKEDRGVGQSGSKADPTDEVEKIRLEYQQYMEEILCKLEESQVQQKERLANKDTYINQILAQLETKDLDLRTAHMNIEECDRLIGMMDKDQKNLKRERDQLKEAELNLRNEIAETRIKLEAQLAKSASLQMATKRRNQSASSGGKDQAQSAGKNWSISENGSTLREFQKTKMNQDFAKMNEELKRMNAELQQEGQIKAGQISALQMEVFAMKEALSASYNCAETARAASRQTLEDERREHAQQLEAERERYNAAVRSMQEELMNMQGALRTAKANLQNEKANIYQASTDYQIKSSQTISSLTNEITKLRKECAMLRELLQTRKAKYRKLKGKYQILRRVFLTAQEGLEEDDLHSTPIDDLAEHVEQDAFAEMDPPFSMTEELLISPSGRRTINTELSRDSGQVAPPSRIREQGSVEVGRSQLFDEPIRTIELQCRFSKRNSATKFERSSQRRKLPKHETP